MSGLKRRSPQETQRTVTGASLVRWFLISRPVGKKLKAAQQWCKTRHYFLTGEWLFISPFSPRNTFTRRAAEASQDETHIVETPNSFWPFCTDWGTWTWHTSLCLPPYSFSVIMKTGISQLEFPRFLLWHRYWFHQSILSSGGVVRPNR